ncbi:MAG TPA: alpha-glucan family phosphorylase, partial [Myxococcota bacterium]
LESELPTYSGGLGVLAGDTIRSAADLGLRMAAVTLVHRRGYFRQALDARGGQTETPDAWQPGDGLEPLEPRVRVEIEGRGVEICAWRYRVRGVHGHEVPVYLLDTQLSGNHERDRALTDSLYGGDHAYRLRQEVVLGIGGVRMLRALGHPEFDRFHLNEGHAALAVVALVEEALGARGDASSSERVIECVRRRCVFTTHTPVPAGHDKFPAALGARVLGTATMQRIQALTGRSDLNLTELALLTARFVNGVAMRHGEVCEGMFPGYPIRSITNGVHPATWAATSFRALFDHHIRHWREDPMSLRYAVGIPCTEIWWAHQRAKQALVEVVNRETAANFDLEALTIGFARRATAYKRASLVFSDLDRLAALASPSRPLQFVFAGKAHPQDEEGKSLIQAIFAAAKRLRGRVSVAYLPGYDMALGRLLCSGCDVWLNTPRAPLEASGTSGMKAALNGVPSLSILDGWWVEGCVEGVTGWAIGTDGHRDAASEPDLRDARALYDKLESAVVPCFYAEPQRFREIMRSAIALNASFFNTHRMVLQYLYDAYRERPESAGT